MEIDDLKSSVKHFTHPHTLKLVKLVPYTEHHYAKCYCCESTYHSSSWVYMYACEQSKCICLGRRYLCLVCLELEESVERHALHPRHPQLKLVERQYTFRECHGCCSYIQGNFSYQCDDDQCDFMLHVKCAHSLKPILQLSSDSHTHSHLLTLICCDSLAVRVLNCEFCHSDIPMQSYFARCVPCNLNFHILCHRAHYDIPNLLMHPQGHPQHPLSRFENYKYWSCDVCYKRRDWPRIPAYICLELGCDIQFTAHLSCVFQSSSPCPFSELVTDVVLADVLINDSQVHKSALCQGCEKVFLNNGLSVFGCQYCNSFVHESCIRRCMHHPIMVRDKDKSKNKGEETLISCHPGYDIQGKSPFVLVFTHGNKYVWCACCGKDCIGFVFQNKKYKDQWFVLDLECMLVVPSLELIGHDHPVTLLQRSNTTRSSYLRCIPCRMKFEIGTSSCLFPRTLLHECHLHPLVLNIKDDAERCYCDVCEDERDPKECFYYCAECRFEAHIGCVRSEVLGPGAIKLKEVQFVTLQEVKQIGEKAKKKIAVKDIFRLKEELPFSCTHGHKELDDIFQASSKMTWENSIGENTFFMSNFSNQTFYSDEPFKEFVERLNSASTSTSRERRSALERLRNEEVVRVGEYLVPLNFDEVLETLFDKYGDFGAKCTCSSREVKQYLFVRVCKTLQDMCNIKVVRVTESLLIEWWTWIAMGKAAGFQIQFALESWERVVFANFGLEADKYTIGELRTARQQIKELPEEIENLERMLDERRRMLKEAKNKENDIREAVFRVKKSPLMKKCLKEAEDLACSTAGETFLPPSH